MVEIVRIFSSISYFDLLTFYFVRYLVRFSVSAAARVAYDMQRCQETALLPLDGRGQGKWLDGRTLTAKPGDTK